MFNPIYSPIDKLVTDDIIITHKNNNQLCSNAAHFEYNNKIYLIPRIQDHTKPFWHKNNFWIDHKNNLLLEFDNINNKIINQKNIIMNNISTNIAEQRFEQFRIFLHNNQIYSNHSFITPMENLKDNNVDGNIFDRVALSILDVESGYLNILNKISSLDKINIHYFERNWSFYSVNNKIYLIYTIEPFIIFISEDNGLTFNMVHQLNYNIKWQNYISNNNVKFRNSCNPIDYDDHNMIMFFHLRDKKTQIYYHGIILLDKITCTIKKFSKQPILFYNTINENCGEFSNFYYLMSIRNNKENNTLELFGGKSHRAISKIILDKNILDNAINDNQIMVTL